MIIKNCFNYIGGKEKLLPQIQKILPTNINLFIDLFCGSATVALNTNAKSYIINDLNFQLINILKVLKIYEENDIVETIDCIINTYGLNKEGKEEFLLMREDYNKNPLCKQDDIKDRKNFLKTIMLYSLITHSFNYSIHINSKNGFSVPSGCGRSYFNKNLRNNLINYIRRLKGIDCKIVSTNYKNLLDKIMDKLNENTVVFIDPPYYCCSDVYSRVHYINWGDDEEYELYKYLDKLNKKRVKFILTNVLENGEKINTYLQDFIKNYNVIELNSNYNNSNYQKEKKNLKEILVYNY